MRISTYKSLIFTAVIGALFVSGSSFAKDRGSKPIDVIVSNVERVSFFDEIEALGTLKANESVDITAKLTERITAISFTDNQRVAQGDILVSLDDVEERAELAEQKAILTEAQSRAKRVDALIKKRVSSEAAQDETRRDLETAKARIQAIEARLAEHNIKAPFDGILGLRNISLGSMVEPSDIITTLDDDSVMKLDFSVPEIFLASLEKGAIIRAKSEAYPNKIFTGTIDTIDSRIDTITRSIEVRALLDNQAGLLKPGLLMQVDIQKNPRNALIIPEESIISDADKNYVFTVKKDDSEAMIVARQAVELGARKRGVVEVLSGLNEDQKIVTHGMLKLRDGASISIKAVTDENSSIKEILKQPKQKTE